MARTKLLAATAASGTLILVLGARAFAQVVSIPTASTTLVRIEGVSKYAHKNRRRSEIPLKAPFAQSTIGKERLEYTSPAETAQTILNQVPSIVATQAGPGGVRTNVQFRAFNDGQFSETYGGISLNDVFNGGVTD